MSVRSAIFCKFFGLENLEHNTFYFLLQILFLCTHLISLPIAFLYGKYLSPLKVSSNVRHYIGAIVGLLFLFLMFDGEWKSGFSQWALLSDLRDMECNFFYKCIKVKFWNTKLSKYHFTHKSKYSSLDLAEMLTAKDSNVSRFWYSPLFHNSCWE